MKGFTRRTLIGLMSLCLVMAFTFSYFVPVSAHAANMGEKSNVTGKMKQLKAKGAFNPIKVTVRLEDVNKTVLEPTEVTVDKLFIDRGDGYWSDVAFEKPMAFLALQKAVQKIGIDTNDKEQFNCGEGGKERIAKIGSGWEGQGFRIIINNKNSDQGIGTLELQDGDKLLIVSSDFSDWTSPIAYFDKEEYKDVKAGDKLKFKLLQNTESVTGDPMEGATLEINGEALGTYKTDSNGEVEYEFKEPGTYHISATGKINDDKFVRPYAKVIVKGDNPQDDKFDVEFITGDGFPEIKTKKIHKGEPVSEPKMDEQVTVRGQLYRFKGWYKDEQFKTKWDFAKEKITENTKIYAKYDKVPKRTIKFELAENYDGVAAPNDVIVNDGDKVVHDDIKYPGKDVYYGDKKAYPFGYVFDDFYVDKECKIKWQLNTSITSDQTVYIKWLKDRYFPKYKVVAMPGGKELPESMRETIAKKPSTTAQGYARGETMVYWNDLREYTYGDDSHTYTGNEEGLWKTKNVKLGKYVNGLPLTGEIKEEDVTITHEMEFIPSFWVDFDTDGASINDSLKSQSGYYVKGSKINRALTESEEVLPKRKGYQFIDWYKDSNRTKKWDFENDTIQADTTLYAKMIPINDETPKYNVEFILNGGKPKSTEGTKNVKPLVLSEGQKIPVEPNNDDIERPGYYFEGWYKDTELKDKWNFYYDRVSADFKGKLYANWYRPLDYQRQFFDVQFKSVNDKEIATKQKVEIGNFISEPKYDMNKYTLKKGWYKDKELTQKWDFKEDVVSKDMTLYGEVEANSSPDPGERPDPGTKPDPDPGSKPDPGERPDPGTKPDPDPGSKPDPGEKPDPGTKHGPDPGSKPDPGEKPDPGTKPDPDPGSKPDPGEKSGLDELKVVTEDNDASVAVKGDRVVYTKGVSNKAVYRIRGKALTVDDLISIQVDGKYVSRENYVAETGSIIITFNKSYMDSLSVGRHEVKFNTTKGIAKAEIVVKDENVVENLNKGTAATTGDSTNIISLVGILTVAAGMYLYLRKRKY